jgi:GNAT superfamily N-acetyltransferase
MPQRRSSKPPTLKLRRSNAGGTDAAPRLSHFLFMSEIRVAAATKDRWPDVRALFEGQGERGCWCQYWRQSSSAYSNAAPGFGESNLQLQVESGPAPGLIAYLDNEPAGWLGFWPRTRMERLVRSRTIPSIDDTPVWSIVCFMVRVGYRRKGVANALLDGAVRFARQSGVPMLEAYPIDSENQRVDVAFGYVGFTSMFEAAGFRRIVETAAKSAGQTRILMRLEL